jgi:hypothetical protein
MKAQVVHTAFKRNFKRAYFSPQNGVPSILFSSLLQRQREQTPNRSPSYIEHIAVHVNPVISFQTCPAFEALHMFDIEVDFFGRQWFRDRADKRVAGTAN